MNTYHGSFVFAATLAAVTSCGQTGSREHTASGGSSNENTTTVEGGAPGGTLEPVTLCNGDQSYGLQAYVASTVDSVALLVQIRNGGQFLHVRGDCTYFVQAGDVNLDPVMTGKLSEDEADQLAHDLQLSEFKTLDGTISQSPGSHQPRSIIAWSGKYVGCDADCKYDPYNNPTDQAAHELLAPIYEKLVRWRTALAERGVPLAGDVRVAVVAWSTDEWKLGTVEWPLNVSPLEYLIASDDLHPVASVVSGEDARSLIDLRNSKRNKPAGAQYSTIEFDGRYYDVVIDETLPGENEVGTVLPDL